MLFDEVLAWALSISVKEQKAITSAHECIPSLNNVYHYLTYQLDFHSNLKKSPVIFITSNQNIAQNGESLWVVDCG